MDTPQEQPYKRMQSDKMDATRHFAADAERYAVSKCQLQKFERGSLNGD